MNVMYCGDAGIERGVVLSVMSLLKACEEPLDVFLITAEFSNSRRTFKPITPAFAAQLERIVRERSADPGPDSDSGPDCGPARGAGSVHLLDATEQFRSCPPTANMETRFTPGCMLRLYADLFPEIPDRVLYLDYDVVCRQSCEELYATDLDGYEFAGVLDYYGRWFFSKRHVPHGAHDYMNSGVLLLNMARMRDTGLLGRCRDLCASKEMFMPDQSALNKLAQAKLVLPRKYNDQRRLHPDTVLQHFSTTWRLLPVPHIVTVKPWDVEGLHGRLHIYEYDGLLGNYLEIQKTIDYDKRDE